MLDMAHELRDHLASGKPIANYPDRNSVMYEELVHEMRFLTSKPVIYAANVDETGLAEDNEYVQAVREFADRAGAEVAVISAKLEVA